MILKLKTAPSTEPVMMDDIVAQCRLDHTTEAPLLAGYITAAREQVEALCGPLLTQTWYQYEDSFPKGVVLRLGKPRVQSVTSVKYTTEDGVEHTLSASDYTVQIGDDAKPSIIVKPDCTWPTDTLYNSNPICIEMICGYGDTADTVPQMIRFAIMLLVSHWCENREPVYAGVNTVQQIPFTVDNLLANFRAWGYE